MAREVAFLKQNIQSKTPKLSDFKLQAPTSEPQSAQPLDLAGNPLSAHHPSEESPEKEEQKVSEPPQFYHSPQPESIQKRAPVSEPTMPSRTPPPSFGSQPPRNDPWST